ncbi:Zc3h12a-like Ribonuclease NYN domain-containing protein [Caenorhabditis elegans]|uniref:Zc3h12a-like Ribonuclease NYN domain-containing protein n=2 Tax=Caenorhabditis elegans TaxID=6239 RepID=A0A078BS27_CAEEL|nr:Zc3h12a-like Ribonuclease NYN domain-containing protein [Caenorhabditis elegans]CDX47431.1 Zc3h12a-like Ribonuclease NYN domain-containing protein [Caenorhabditis elegans]|eukprot:NP_001293627.1 Enhanced RNAI (RNA interference) [Caenorhabditis elegans]
MSGVQLSLRDQQNYPYPCAASQVTFLLYNSQMYRFCVALTPSTSEDEQVVRKSEKPASKPPTPEVEDCTFSEKNNDQRKIEKETESEESSNLKFPPARPSIRNATNFRRIICISESDSGKEEPVVKKEVLKTNKLRISETKPEYPPELLQLEARLQELRAGRKNKQGRINRKFVAKPCGVVSGETPQRPFLEEMYYFNPQETGTASEIFDMLFPAKDTPNFRPWLDGHFSAPDLQFKQIEKQRQTKLHSYTGTTLQEKKRKKRKKILKSIQEILWLLHFQKHDDFLESTSRLTIKNFSCHFDEHQRLKLLRNNDLSLICNYQIGSENTPIFNQRSTDCMLRPVFIDGLSFMDMLIPISSSLPIISTRSLLEILLNFILDGCQTVIYLPDYYNDTTNQKVDDSTIFQFLCNSKLIQFVDGRSRRAVERQVLLEAEKVHGVFVSSAEEFLTRNAIQCFPVINRYSKRLDEFLICTVFLVNNLPKKILAQDFVEESRVLKPEGSSSAVSSTTVLEESHQKISGAMEDSEDEPADPQTLKQEYLIKEECSEISEDSEEGAIVDVASSSGDLSENRDQKSENEEFEYSPHQLTLEQQTYLISSMAQLSIFHFQRYRQIRVFLMIIKRYVPELLPSFMQKTRMDDVAMAIQDIQNGKDLLYWPIFSKIDN